MSFIDEVLAMPEFLDRLIKRSVSAEMINDDYGKRGLLDAVRFGIELFEEIQDEYSRRLVGEVTVTVTKEPSQAKDYLTQVRGVVLGFRRRYPEASVTMVEEAVRKALAEQIPSSESWIE